MDRVGGRLISRARILILAAAVSLAAGGLVSQLRGESAPTVGRLDQVWVVRSDGQGLRKLTSGRSHQSPTCSPDSRRLAFTARGRRGAIEIASLESGMVRRVPLNPRLGRPDVVAWSPRRDQLAFDAIKETRTIAKRSVATVRLDGSGLRRLATHPFGSIVDSGPVWSPDGERIAYIRQRKFRPRRHPRQGQPPPVVPATEALDLAIVAPKGGVRRMPLRGDDSSPRWSPHGRSILLVRGMGLWRVSPSGERPRPVARRLVGPIEADWSPDSRSVAFSGVTFKGDRRTHLYVVDASGRALPRLLVREVALVRPAWSPKGDLFAFADFEGRLRAIGPDGTGERTLATLPGASIGQPDWSPDGRWIAFTAARKPPSD
jgi:Tol biopolymer transport system component